MRRSSPLPQPEAVERLLVLFGHSIPRTSSWKRSSAVTNRCSRTSSSARQSRMQTLAIPSYGIPRAGGNKGGFRPKGDVSYPRGGGRNKRGFDFWGQFSREK